MTEEAKKETEHILAELKMFFLGEKSGSDEELAAKIFKFVEMEVFPPEDRTKTKGKLFSVDNGYSSGKIKSKPTATEGPSDVMPPLHKPEEIAQFEPRRAIKFIHDSNQGNVRDHDGDLNKLDKNDSLDSLGLGESPENNFTDQGTNRIFLTQPTVLNTGRKSSYATNLRKPMIMG